MGVAIDRVTEGQVIERILSAIAERRGGWVVTPNVDMLRKASRDASVRALIAAGDLVVADGMPLVWASRLQRLPLPSRVAGSTLVQTLSESAARAGVSIFLLGGNVGAAEKAARALRSSVPELRISGHHCPPIGFEDSAAEMQEIIRVLDLSEPNIVFCAFGFPKQERLILELRKHFPSTWFLGIGISLSFVGGEIPRSPEWMQRIGLEWLHRLLQEPKRLFRRYILDDIPFALRRLSRAALIGAFAQPDSPRTA